MLISPTEPPIFHELGKVSSLSEKYGSDFLILAKTTRIGIQRKVFPNDLLASLADGRLYDQIRKMVELDHAILILEGYGQWTSEGTLMHTVSFTRDQLHGLMMSLAFEFGIQVFQVRGTDETIQLLTNLEKWVHKPAHTSLLRRPGPPKDSWNQKSERMNGIHFLQGFLLEVHHGRLSELVVDLPLSSVQTNWHTGIRQSSRIGLRLSSK